MGDRFVIGFRADKDADIVWAYSHYGGSDRFQILARMIEAARSRWGDPSYATRIAISQLVGSHWESTTGFGINAGEACDVTPDHPALLVTWKTKRIGEVDELDWGPPATSTSFDQFLSDHAKLSTV